MPDAASQHVHHHVACFLVALAQLVELQRGDRLTDMDAEHQSGYAAEAVRRVMLDGSAQLHVAFTSGIPFVHRSPLRAAPWVFRKLESLARALGERGWSELRISSAIQPSQVVDLAACIAAPDGVEAPPNVELGTKVFEELSTVLSIDSTAPATTLARAYASVMAVLMDARGELKRNEMPNLTRLTRAAQVVVELADTRRLAATLPTALRVSDDRAARWVDTSILAAEMCRFVSLDRGLRRAVALASLLLSLAPFDERGAASLDGHGSMSHGERLVEPSRLAARTLGLLITIPGAAQVARLPTALACEAQLRRYRFLASSGNSSRLVSLEAVLIATAVRFYELRTKVGGDDVLDATFEGLRAEAMDDRDDLALRLLLAALGTLPREAIVEFDTKEVGRVTSPAREVLPLEPEVEILVDRRGKSLEPSAICDLAAAKTDEPKRRIRAVLALASNAETLPAAGSRDRIEPPKQKPTRGKSRSTASRGNRILRKKAAPSPRPSRPAVLGLDIIEDLVEPGDDE